MSSNNHKLFDAASRKRMGLYFTPAPLVDYILKTVSPLIPKRGPVAIIDPSCGNGAFLASAAARFPKAIHLGLELSPLVAAECRTRVPKAIVLEGDSLRDGLEPLLAHIPPGAFELWIGNPPYNGNSPALADKTTYTKLQTLLPSKLKLPKGTSLRDDYAFFLLLAAQRLSERPGALAFVTSASLLDSFLYTPVRLALLQTLTPRAVVELGSGVFEQTKVKTCVTFWNTSAQRSLGATYQQRQSTIGGFDISQLSTPVVFSPRAPDWQLRPGSDAAEELDARWRSYGVPLTQLVPISFPGLKTRFDELLVDENPQILFQRIDAFLRTPAEHLLDFAVSHSIPQGCMAKLESLKKSLDVGIDSADSSFICPFFRYAGARHRGSIPSQAMAYCYLDRRLIPRGDHRFHGPFNPHSCPTKLVFNTRELPLSAALLERPGCVHAHRHARFAPLTVPQRIRDEGLDVCRSGANLGQDVPNLSAQGVAWAQQIGDPLEVFRALVTFINSPEVQEIWAPAFGASRDLPVPIKILETRSS